MSVCHRTKIKGLQIIICCIPCNFVHCFYQVFTDTFLCQETVWEETFVDIVTSCCFTVLSNTQLASCLLSKFEGYVSG